MFFINLDKDSDERFDFGKFMEQVNGEFDPLSSDMLYSIKKLNLGGKYQINSEVSRPDQLARIIYGNTQYWWILMLYNDIQEVDGFKAGMFIKYPDKSELDDYYFSLKQKELAKAQ